MIDLFLFDKEKNVIGILPQKSLISYVQEQELNGTITAEVHGIYSEEIEKAVYFGSKDVERSNIFWRYKIISSDVNSSDKTFSFKGMFELFDDLKNRTVIKDKRPKDVNARYALDIVLEGTTWQVGSVKSNNVGSSNWYYKSSIEAFWDYLEKWRVEFKPRMIFSNGKVIAKYIDIENQISDNYGKWYEYGDKLLNVTAEADTSNLATAFYIRGKGEERTNEDGELTGYGRRITIADVEWSKSKGDPEDKPKGQEYIVLAEATKLYGFEDGSPRFATITLEDIEDKQELLELGYQEALKLSRPQRQFKATITEDEFAELGEISTIIDTRLNIRYQTRTFKIKRDFLNKKIKEIEFGDRLIKSRTEIIEDVSNKKISENSFKTDIKISNLKTELNENQNKIIDDKLQQIRDGLIGDYWKSTAYTYNLQNGNKYNLPAGIYSFDKPIDEEPSKAIYLGAGLLLISDSKKANGDWDWSTVASGSGVNADTINSGTINGNFVNVTNLKAEDVLVGAEAAKATLAEFLENSQKKAQENHQKALDEIAKSEQSAKEYADGKLEQDISNVKTEFETTMDALIDELVEMVNDGSEELRYDINQINETINRQITDLERGNVGINQAIKNINVQIYELEQALRNAGVPQDIIDQIIGEARTNAEALANAAEERAKSYAKAQAEAAKRYADEADERLKGFFTSENIKTLDNIEAVQRQVESLTSTQNDIDRILAENESKLGEITKALDEFDPTDFEGLVSSEDFYIAKNEFENATEEYNRILIDQFSTNEETQDALNRLENSRDELTDSLQNFLDELSGISEQLDEVRRVIYTDEKGRLNVSKPGSEAHLTLDNDELSIRNNNDDRLAYFGADKMYIPNAQVNDRLYLGGRYYILIDSDGSFSINWI